MPVASKSVRDLFVDGELSEEEVAAWRAQLSHIREDGEDVVTMLDSRTARFRDGQVELRPRLSGGRMARLWLRVLHNPTLGGYVAHVIVRDDGTIVVGTRNTLLAFHGQPLAGGRDRDGDQQQVEARCEQEVKDNIAGLYADGRIKWRWPF